MLPPRTKLPASDNRRGILDLQGVTAKLTGHRLAIAVPSTEPAGTPQVAGELMDVFGQGGSRRLILWRSTYPQY